MGIIRGQFSDLLITAGVWNGAGECSSEFGFPPGPGSVLACERKQQVVIFLHLSSKKAFRALQSLGQTSPSQEKSRPHFNYIVAPREACALL